MTIETLTIQGFQVQLLPEKAVYIPELAALLVADVHLGKPETFQRYGIPIPHQVNQATLARLQQAYDRTDARQLMILGDLFHAKVGLVDEVIENWLQFLERTQLEAHLILGNHDRALADSLAQCSLTCHTQPIQRHPWCLSHEPLVDANGDINICGHIHPCVRIGGKGDRLRLPCFHWEPTGSRLTLPSFGDFTGGYTITLKGDAIAYVIADDTVVPLQPTY